MLHKTLIVGYTQVYESETGGWVWQHELHFFGEIQENLQASKILADHGHRVEMLPCIAACEVALRKILLPDAFGFKNPDVRLNFEKIGDIKTPAKNRPVTRKSIKRAVYSAGQQKVKIVIINLDERDYNINEVKKGIMGALQPLTNKSIEEIWIITKRKKIFIVTRETVFDDYLYDRLEIL